MRRSVLEAVQEGDWEFEPKHCDDEHYEPTSALPGSPEKLTVLKDRLRRGLPLWHPSDRIYYSEHLVSSA